ncbi:MAG: hypothetical protein V3T05_07055 [Myxococcota bacterium]
MLPKPARLILEGAADGATVVVNWVRTLIDPWTRHDPILVPLPLAPGAGSRTYDVLVRDQSGNSLPTRRVTFRPGETVILQCAESPSNP